MYDDYNGYYDLYVASNLRIVRFLSRDEIIATFLNMPSLRTERFVAGYRLNSDEIEQFKLAYTDDVRVLRAIAYYQENDTVAYNSQKIYTFLKTIKFPKE